MSVPVQIESELTGKIRGGVSTGMGFMLFQPSCAAELDTWRSSLDIRKAMDSCSVQSSIESLAVDLRKPTSSAVCFRERITKMKGRPRL
jgi:hypothetical protein